MHEPDHATRSALLDAARVCSIHGGTAIHPFAAACGLVGDVVVSKLKVGDRRRDVLRQTHRIAIRVDVVAARAQSGTDPPSDEAIDAWLSAQEWALNELWIADHPAFDASKRLGVDVDGNRPHVITHKQHRMSLWFVFEDRAAATVSP